MSKSRGGAFKDTAGSLIIAFVMAFVFRGFVVEAFVIPTGSMAPTLLGQHMRFTSPESGTTWTVNPWANRPGTPIPAPVQGSTERPITVTDPMTGAHIGQELPGEMGAGVPLLAGDRIFVLKYLYSVFDPSRFDVVVFKYPGQAPSAAQAGEQENYIKRLLGLPGEEIALADGDVFVRPAGGTPGAWGDGDWTIARKSERTQRELWQPVYDSRSYPLHPERDLSAWFHAPWAGLTPAGERDAGWAIDGRASYEYTGSGETMLAWDAERWPICDRYPYNEIGTRGLVSNPLGGPFPVPPSTRVFPVGDVRLACGFEPRSGEMGVSAVVLARGHEFRADVAGTRVVLRMRPHEPGQSAGEWREIGTGELAREFGPGRVWNLEFWHADQRLGFFVDGREVANAAYEWSPALRIEHATGGDADALLEPAERGNALADGLLYHRTSARWEFRGGACTLHRVRLDRDIYYQPDSYHVAGGAGAAARATHPGSPLVLGADHFFVCGDNSPNSLDGRLWTGVDPWVGAEIDPTPGVVHRDLLIGKAFFVYFPGVHEERKIPIPDVGRMRFIW